MWVIFLATDQLQAARMPAWHSDCEPLKAEELESLGINHLRYGKEKCSRIARQTRSSCVSRSTSRLLGRDAAAPESLVRTKTGRAEWLSGIVRGIRSSNTIDRSQDITLIPTMHFLERNPQLWMLNALIE